MRWAFIRPDALTVWRNPDVRRRLGWYRLVMSDKAPARFLLARLVPVEYDPRDTLERLLEIHNKNIGKITKLANETIEDRATAKRLMREALNVAPGEENLLDLKARIAYILAARGMLCERKCGIDRRTGRIPPCRTGWHPVVHSWFLHLGEEAPLVPSGTIFYGGCNFTCVYCQNWDISQTNPRDGLAIETPQQLAAIQEELREKGAKNINHVGGEPTPNLHYIIDSFRHLKVNVPQIWNSNMYMSMEAAMLLAGIIDLWLPDFKYGNNRCAFRLSAVPKYWETVTRNLLIASRHGGDMIIRHLVLPGHIECCTRPVLGWISENLQQDKIMVNIMGQYRPEHLVRRYPERWPELDRYISYMEMVEIRKLAGRLGLSWEPVS
ncbi:MAG: radical SAM protein [Desulfurococcales archaeon]|nr:radical SAM protein [Desulfurococcales archaeon]